MKTVRWHRLDLKAKSYGGANDGAKNFMGGNYTVYEAVQEVICQRCQREIPQGNYFTIRGKMKKLPICRECHPFTEYDPWQNVTHAVLTDEEIRRGLELAGQEED